jgi:hypothetical protein
MFSKLAEKVPWPFGDWIALYRKGNTLAETRSVSWYAPGPKSSCTQSMVRPISQEFYFPHRKVFRRPVTGHQMKGRFVEAAVPHHKIGPIQK